MEIDSEITQMLKFVEGSLNCCNYYIHRSSRKYDKWINLRKFHKIETFKNGCSKMENYNT